MVFLWILLGFIGFCGVYLGIGCVVLLRRFTCGGTLEQALAVARSYNKKSVHVLINYACEGGHEGGDAIVDIYKQIFDAMKRAGIHGDISVKPSSLVDARDQDSTKSHLFARRLRLLLRYADLMNRRVWLDEERTGDCRWVNWALELFRKPGEANHLAIRVRAYTSSSHFRLKWILEKLKNSRVMIGVCRGTYRADCELTVDETEARIEALMRLCKEKQIPCVLASHTLASPSVEMAKSEKVLQKPIIHMLHGRREVQEVLVPMVARGEIFGGVYIIYGPLLRRICYGWRRVKERPSLLMVWPRELA